MSLFDALNTATSALAVDQAGITVTGNNIANVGNANYSRETATVTPSQDTEVQPGIFVGTGVDLTSVQRQVDSALNSRLRGSQSDNSSAQTTANWVGQVQSTLNALSGSDLSAQLSTFFTGWSNLANNPTDSGLRQVVIQNGQNTAGYLQNLDGQLNGLQTNVNQELPLQVSSANNLATQIASLNVQIATAQNSAGGSPNSLLDQRDAALSQLSQLVNINTQDQPDGTVNVFVGSQPLVVGQTNNGLSMKNETDANGNVTPTVIFTNDNGTVPATSGVIGALQSVKSQITSATDQINTIAHNLIDAVNQVHASGQGTAGFTSVTSTNTVNDPTKALASTAAGLDFTPKNGSFVVTVTQADGTASSTLVPVNLTGSANDTTLNSLATSLNGIAGVSATINAGQLTIKSTGANAKISFSQDSSGTLADLGINTFFTGKDASDIAVNSTVSSQTSLLAAGSNGEPGDNTAALAISNLESASLPGLGGESLESSYQNLVNDVGNSAATATTNATAAKNVQDALSAQQQGVSGVSLNEEAVNLIQQQQAFQAAAQVVTTVNQMFASMLAAFTTL
jgi:flagellar hook-associated protein 1 FlgK